MVHKKVKDLAEIQLGYQLRSKVEHDEHGDTLLIQAKDINKECSRIDYSSALRFTPERDTSKQLLENGDVLFMGKGSSPFACLVTEVNANVVAGGMFYILRPRRELIHPKYMAWLLNRNATLRRLLVISGTGVAMPVIRKKELANFSIPVPALHTQQEIGDILRCADTEQELLSQLARQKQILTEVICKRLSEETIMEKQS